MWILSNPSCIRPARQRAQAGARLPRFVERTKIFSPYSRARVKVARSSYSTRRRARQSRFASSRLGERYEIVFPGTLQNQKRRCSIAPVGDKVRTTWSNRIGLARRKSHFFLGLAQKDPQLFVQNVKRVLDVRMTMPRHFLRRSNREFRYPESRTHYVMRQARDFVDIICGALWTIHTFPLRSSASLISTDLVSGEELQIERAVKSWDKTTTILWIAQA